ncbi:Hsp70 family protein, partial [Mycolicibacterium austroafricanum]|uniref:Hsp70 family protein n=1 Tax=Mycolicibacterium austroafricanum TaxID=39687 RepID=UPI000CF92D29
MRSSLGVSLGVANLIAVADGRPTVRRATVTLAPPSLTGFVDRVGDPVPLVAADGSRHYADRLAADAIEAATRLARPHRRPDVAAVAAPAHWPESAVAALRARMPHLTVVPDAVAALTAVHAERGLPARGVVVLCDFGATGSSITLVDAGDGMTVIGHTVRSDDFSGDLVDQLVLRHVVTGLDLDPSGTSAVASLADLRVLCRGAKEGLSADTATALPSAHTTVRLTRAELDDVIAGPLDLFVAALIDTLQRNGVPHARLAAVVTVGGGAAIPLVAQRLSEALRVPVVTPADPQAAAAAGAELLALRVAEPEVRTTLVPAPTVAAAAVPLAWSAAAEEPALVEFASYDTDYARPEVRFDRADDAFTDPAPWPWYRRPGVVFAGAATLAAAAVTAFVMTSQAVEAGTTPAGSPGIATPVAVAPLEAAVEAPATPAPVAPAVPFPGTGTVVAAPAPGPAAAPAPGPVQQGTVTKQAAPRPAPAPAAAPAPA